MTRELSRKKIDVNGVEVTLIQKKENYKTYQEVRIGQKLVGLVSAVYGNSDRPKWDACDFYGNPIGDPRSKQYALFPIGEFRAKKEKVGGGLWLTRLAAVAAILKANRR